MFTGCSGCDQWVRLVNVVTGGVIGCWIYCLSHNAVFLLLYNFEVEVYTLCI